jgi:hypothetical protein
MLIRFVRKFVDVESVDEELSKKIAEELKLEATMDEGTAIPLSIQEYLQKGPFKVLPP